MSEVVAVAVVAEEEVAEAVVPAAEGVVDQHLPVLDPLH